MKALVFSDSHGHTSSMCAAIERETPDIVFHLGDGWQDIMTVMCGYPELPLYQVTGNCDWGQRGPDQLELNWAGLKLFLCHGHRYGVKTGLDVLTAYGVSREADVVLFGHTHQPLAQQRSGIWIFNPGSIGTGWRPSYGLLTAEQDKIDCEIIYLKGS